MRRGRRRALAWPRPPPRRPALEVERPDASDLLVPLVRDAVRSVDVRGGRIDVDTDFLAE
jgi:16S rRNA processing protein RimM